MLHNFTMNATIVHLIWYDNIRGEKPPLYYYQPHPFDKMENEKKNTETINNLSCAYLKYSFIGLEFKP